VHEFVRLNCRSFGRAAWTNVYGIETKAHSPLRMACAAITNEWMEILTRKSKTTSCAIVVIVASLSATTLAEAADTFRKLKDSEIRPKVSGMEIVDVDDHWAEQYMRDGSLKVFAMSKLTTGKWRVQKGELCIQDGTPDSGCGEVWISGNKIEFRGEGPRLGLQGILQKQQPRK
jgi:hypothetical protein